jgi:hypothetical protein
MLDGTRGVLYLSSKSVSINGRKNRVIALDLEEPTWTRTVSDHIETVRSGISGSFRREGPNQRHYALNISLPRVSLLNPDSDKSAKMIPGNKASLVGSALHSDVRV